MHQVKTELEEIQALIRQGLINVDLPEKKKELEKLNYEMGQPDFWNDPQKAAEVSQKASAIGKSIEAWEKISKDADELLAMVAEIAEDSDPKESQEFLDMVEGFKKSWRTLEISTFLGGKFDANNAILSIHAGTGGTDAQDFGEMLMRMYLRYAERMGFKTEVLDKSDGDEAGIKSCTILIRGQFGYGYLKGENGVHRLVRLSPFNSKNTRETSFVLVEVLPEITAAQEIKIDPDDLKIDVYRSSGAGGQNVQKTSSAVRITHVPTGIVAACQNERSQLQNKEQAMKVLTAKLVDLMEQKQAKELKDIKGEKVEMSWGHQIRSYVLHPYKMVKDHRTDYEEGNAEAVLDGELDGFIEAELKKK
ncbi:MAG: peptide chain release factor 2 [Candidatus Gracilibacteria bacterium]|jgi:peptide chain release factor 2